MTVSRHVVEQLFSAAVRAADPYAATRTALEGSAPGARTWIISLGKAAIPMARAALDELNATRRTPLGGVVVTSDSGTTLPPLVVVTGDHPVPDAGSLAAADAVSDVVRLVQSGDDVLVLVSGGASSLMAAPVGGVGLASMRELFRTLHAAGVPIGVMNAFRKRVMRWSAGRLAAALSGARVTCLIVSDVIGDDPASIASGPCSGDPWHAGELIALARQHRFWTKLPDDVRRYLEATERGENPESPKPGTMALESVVPRVILGNRDALEGVRREAMALGLTVRVAPVPITGAARSTGDAIAATAIATRAELLSSPRASTDLTAPCRQLLVWGGETTVALTNGSPGRGGRAQELALAAARTLHEAGAAGRGITILSAGTDGRDGPTDAAGAIVDAHSWTRSAMAGGDPLRALDTHDAYSALDAAGALLRIGNTGTNVNDVVLALVD